MWVGHRVYDVLEKSKWGSKRTRNERLWSSGRIVGRTVVCRRLQQLYSGQNLLLSRSTAPTRYVGRGRRLPWWDPRSQRVLPFHLCPRLTGGFGRKSRTSWDAEVLLRFGSAVFGTGRGGTGKSDRDEDYKRLCLGSTGTLQW